ncbi:Cro/CI family transcriptional regulator [Marichromatium gracile]|uniref:DNA-binding transcriptional regulator Cro n=1 Tax=Marichromatium gracile TaxID=1048 RepID=A0A4R4ABF4_MARGR|nr:Cro/CI family transcriptional regulator [Marichromatium gracile]MBK1710657.1 hypothetical protein [Marichromatium gracile]MBO8087730.1 hypothetical protein [Marichromatium sp.]TCW36307.1 DNA-binding transcriptional regulator Cro [Marichromatium gracile]
MITKTALIAALGSPAAVAAEAGCSRQAVAQWGEVVPLRSAVRIAARGRWSLHQLRPDLFPAATPPAIAREASMTPQPTRPRPHHPPAPARGRR